MGAMGRNIQPDHVQQFERAIATIFTCRSVIKYNAALNEEQKNELFAEIDAAAQFLQERLVANAAIEGQTPLPLPPLSFGEIISISQAGRGGADDSGAGETDDQSLLQGFYKLYNTLLKKRDGKGVEFFVSRYNEVMEKLNDVQFKVEKDSPTYFGHLMIDNEIDHVRGFVTDLYCMFTEFASAISGIVEGRDIYIDTEKISSTRQQSLDNEQQQDIFDIAPLIKVQQTLAQFNRRNGVPEDRVADATALLILLEDHLDPHLEKREEIASQIKNLITLLHDLSHLLADYEQAAMLLLAQVG